MTQENNDNVINLPTEVPVLPQQLSETDKMVVELAKSKLENANLQFRNTLLGLFRKYQLNDQDEIAADGTIVRK